MKLSTGRLLSWLAILLLTACAQPARLRGEADSHRDDFSGRLALSVQSQPPQSFAAAFELRGNPQTGELILATPLGSTLARINWDAGTARLKTATEERSFSTLDALLERLTGTAIPAIALFDWLRGRDNAVPGWQADLSRWAEGRVSARRDTPQPLAELRIVLEK